MTTDGAARGALAAAVPGAWGSALADVTAAPSFRALDAFVAEERRREDTEIYPSADDCFRALRLTAPDDVRAVIVGQDPYHGVGQAHGLCFSVAAGTRVPPSLRNVLLEWSADLDRPVPAHGSLERWARNGVLLLNTVMTVRRGEPASHAKQGWEAFTDGILRTVAARPDPVAFLLWGSAAESKRPLLGEHHVVVASNHPSPLSATRPPVPFRGSRPFSTANARLTALGQPPIDWRLDED
jgi:uracil-DNA glycosylase